MVDFARKMFANRSEDIELLRRDLRNPQVHREFNITVKPGQKREVSRRYLLLMINKIGGVFALMGFGAVFVFSFIKRGDRTSRARRLVCIVLALLVAQPVGGFSGLSCITSQLQRLKSRPLTAGQSDSTLTAKANEAHIELPLSFESNHGQTDPEVKFISPSSLKGKKVAKNIPAGLSVRLQVRNPDGLASPELNFTRP